MINFSFNIRTPFKYVPWKEENILSKTWAITKNKSLELQWERYTTDIIGVGFYLNIRQSHAGCRIHIDLLTNSFMIAFEDNRHWDYDKGDWEVCDDAEMV